MRKDQIKAEVKKAQAIVDQLVPGKVRVAAHKYAEGGMCMVGYYDRFTIDTVSRPDQSRLYVEPTSKMEKLDRFYSVDVFTAFFKQRAAYMNASSEDQASFQGHPALYGKPQMEGFLAKDNQ